MVDSSGNLKCAVYQDPTCPNPAQTYVPYIKACAGPCPANSALDSLGRCMCSSGYSAIDPTKVDNSNLQCEQCAPNQFAPTPQLGCYCRATQQKGPCPATPTGSLHRRTTGCAFGEQYCPGEASRQGIFGGNVRQTNALQRIPTDDPLVPVCEPLRDRDLWRLSGRGLWRYSERGCGDL